MCFCPFPRFSIINSSQSCENLVKEALPVGIEDIITVVFLFTENALKECSQTKTAVNGIGWGRGFNEGCAGMKWIK
jgi:hypothetical protein